MKKTPFATFVFTKRKYIYFAIFFMLSSVFTTSLCRKVGNFPVSEGTLHTIISGNNFVRFNENKLPPFHSPFFREVAEKEETIQPAPIPQSPPAVNIQPVAVTEKRVPQNIKITNNTSLSINTAALMATPPAFLSDNNLSVLIVHTHTTESYTPSPSYEYTATDTDRTLDKNFNMVRVGNTVKEILSEKGIPVYHDTTINDYPSYNGSYNKSGLNIKNHLSANPSTKIVLDIHRDAIGTSTVNKTKYITEIDGKNAACIMFVAGSDQSGLTHSNWKENLSFALLLQEHTSRLYPDLCRPLNLRKQRFNQQLSPGAIIVEVGTNGNTLEEALYGAELFAHSLADFLNSF